MPKEGQVQQADAAAPDSERQRTACHSTGLRAPATRDECPGRRRRASSCDGEKGRFWY